MLPVSLKDLPGEVRAAVEVKFAELMDELYQKVLENLSGKILQVKSGRLRESIMKEIDTKSDPMYGIIAPDPEDGKARALELGGQGYYPILGKPYLAFPWEEQGRDVVVQSVSHPPSRRFAYMSSAYDEMEEIFAEKLLEAIGKGLGVG
jgi:hypothetical protein